MKFIINLLRFIIALYVGLFFIIAAYFYSNKKYYNTYPNVGGYAYYIVEDDKLEPDIPNGTFVVLKREDSFSGQVGEYILFENSGLYRIEQIKENDLMEEYIVGFTNDDKSEYLTIKKNDMLYKVYYHSTTLTTVYKILSNWIVLLILILFLVLSPSLTYKRFEL